MVRLRCAKCYSIWERKPKFSRGQLIRCPSCRAVLGKMSKPMKAHEAIGYMIVKAIDEYGNEAIKA